MKTTKILAISDLHHWDSQELELLKNKVYDICVLLGDINDDALHKLKNIIPTDIVGVVGNHDDWNSLKRCGIKDINMRLIEKNDVFITGFSGSSAYKNTDAPMLTQKESILYWKGIPKADILISHDSMYHLFSKDRKDKVHCGLMGISIYNLIKRPKLNICGHHHINKKVKKYGITTICVYRAAIIDYPTLELQQIF